MTELEEMQFEFLPTAEAESGIVFGIGADISVDEDGFAPGGLEWFTQDGENPLNGSTSFGEDHLLGPTWNWQAHVNRHSTTSAVETLGRLGSAWRAALVRDMPGEVCAIRYRLAHRDRRIFGRPRRCEYSLNNLILNGYTPVAMDFKAADANIYDDLESSVTVGLSSESQGGFIFPVVFPVTTLPSGIADLPAEVGGDVETYPIIRFNGGVTDPALDTDSWGVSLKLTIEEGDFVEIDTRPWVQTVLLNGSESVAGALGSRQWLSEMVLEPGVHEMRYRGSGSVGNSTCEVRWRSAWATI
jgi:hypothetical protein